jgi:hypothetical protein
MDSKKANIIIRTAQSLKLDFNISDEKAVELAAKMYENLEKLIEKYQSK